MEVTEVSQSAEAKFGVAGSVLVAVYKGSTTLPVLEELDRVQGAALQKHAKLSMLTIIGQLSSMKTDDGVRARSVELGKKYDGQMRGSAIVVTTKGLAAVMVRTFLSGFFLLSKSEMPMKTFASVAEALAWLQSLPGQDLDVKTELSAADIEKFIA